MNQANSIAGKSTLFVGDLAMFCKESDLLHMFSPFGEVAEIKIMKSEETNRNLSYGFVRFINADNAKEAMTALDGKLLCGRPLRIRWAAYKNKFGPKESRVDGLDNSPVHVSFISYQVDRLVSEESLRMLFNKYGKVQDASIKKSMIDMETRRQSGYGFVYFSISTEGVAAAVESARHLADTTVDDVNYKCSISHNLMKYLHHPSSSNNHVGRELHVDLEELSLGRNDSATTNEVVTPSSAGRTTSTSSSTVASVATGDIASSHPPTGPAGSALPGHYAKLPSGQREAERPSPRTHHHEEAQSVAHTHPAQNASNAMPGQKGAILLSPSTLPQQSPHQPSQLPMSPSMLPPQQVVPPPLSLPSPPPQQPQPQAVPPPISLQPPPQSSLPSPLAASSQHNRPHQGMPAPAHMAPTPMNAPTQQPPAHLPPQAHDPYSMHYPQHPMSMGMEPHDGMYVMNQPMYPQQVIHTSPVLAYNPYVPTMPAAPQVYSGMLPSQMAMPAQGMVPRDSMYPPMSGSPAGAYRTFGSPNQASRQMRHMAMGMVPSMYMLQPTAQVMPPQQSPALSSQSADSVREEQLSYVNYLISPVTNYFQPMGMSPTMGSSSLYGGPFGQYPEPPYGYGRPPVVGRGPGSIGVAAQAASAQSGSPVAVVSDPVLANANHILSPPQMGHQPSPGAATATRSRAQRSASSRARHNLSSTEMEGGAR